MLQVRKKQIAIYILCWIIFLSSLAVDHISLYMIEAIIMFIYIFWKARFSFFMELSFILVFSLFQTWIQATTGKAYGMIENNQAGTPLYESEHAICTLLFLITLLFFIEFTKLIENEKKLYETRIEIDIFVGILFLIIAIILIIMIFPSFPMFKIDSLTRRTQGISSVFGWIVVALLLVSLTYDLSFKYKWMRIGYVFIIFWVLGHGERVEILGFVSYMALKSFNRSSTENKTLSRREKCKLVIRAIGILFGLFVFLMFLIWIGLYREYGGTYRLGYIVQKLFVQATAGDVVYVFDCAVDMWKKDNLVHGITYLDYILQLIPGGSNQYSVGQYIKNFYYTVGGALFFTEPMMNFGILGVIITNVTFCMFYYWVVHKRSLFRAMFWIPYIIEIFRTAWYGRDGWVLAAFIEVPLLFLAIKYFLNLNWIVEIIKNVLKKIRELYRSR